ncbi:MAG: tetratricopeptide repeat protein [Alphaproteobacteria bacterium]|nr:tetratricopeptide repeat protein [Alphaproteobacteria bacterium]
MRRIVPLIALLLSGCAAQQAPSVQAESDKNSQAFSTYLSARFAAGEHDLPQAARYYGQSLSSDPANPSLLALSFFYSTTSGDFDAAGKYAQAVITATPDDRAARLALAVIGFKHKDYPEVRKQLSASAKGPFTALTLALFDAWAAAAERDTAGMQKDLQSLMEQKGAESMAAFHTALLQDYLNNASAADAAYKKALGSTAPTPRVLEAYGRFLERQGRSEDATKLYQSHITEGGLASVTRPGLARIAAGEKPEGMIRSPADGAAEALFGIAASLTDAQSSEVSILYLRMALYLRSDLGLAQVLLADRFETLRKYDSAIAIYRGIEPSSPYWRMAQVQASLDLQRLGKNDDAIAGLKKLVAANPDDSESWVALGDTYRASEKFAESVDAYNHAEKVIKQPARRDWPMFYARAMAKEKLKRLDESEADIQTALKLSPEQPELLNYLGYSWVDRGRNIPIALTMLEKARTLRPYDGYIVDSVGWAYFQLGRYDDAAKTLEAAVLLVPGDPTINDHLGDALWRAGRRIEARFQWNHALTFSDTDTDKMAIERKLKTGLSEKPA